ncbi:hypothetical protein ACXGQW_00140 [Wenyingzhuangia sp. IMCC45533]
MQNSSKYSFILMAEAGSKPVNNVNYFDKLGNRKNVTDAIEKITGQIEDEKIVILKSGLEIPITRIHSVDQEISPYYSDDFFSCDCV